MTEAARRFLDEDKALACVHCGLCLGSCPTYLETGNENDSPRGRIYLMRAFERGQLKIDADSARHIDLCLGCRACEVACPSGVQYGALLEATREKLGGEVKRSLWQQVLRRVIIHRIIPYPRRMRLAAWPAQWLKRSGAAGWLPGWWRRWLDLLPERPSAGRLPAKLRAIGERKGRVGLVEGCVMQVLFADTNSATARLICQAGFDVVTPERQECCGALFAHSGDLGQARVLARANIAAFEEAEVDWVVINAAGCGSTLKEYHHLLEKDADWGERARRFVGKVRDITEFLVEHGGEWASRSAAGKVTYHDACHLAHAQQITRQPRQIVEQVAGKNYVALAESDVCCGSAGSYNLTEPAMAGRLQRRKVDRILESGAEVVVTTNPGCMLQMEAGLRQAGASHVRVVHLADWLAELEQVKVEGQGDGERIA